MPPIWRLGERGGNSVDRLTPRTDAVQIDMEQSTNTIEYQAHQYRDLARQLERELRALSQESVRPEALEELAKDADYAQECALEHGLRIVELKCLGSRIRALSPARVAEGEETAWLIERGQRVNQSPPIWWKFDEAKSTRPNAGYA